MKEELLHSNLVKKAKSLPPTEEYFEAHQQDLDNKRREWIKTLEPKSRERMEFIESFVSRAKELDIKFHLCFLNDKDFWTHHRMYSGSSPYGHEEEFRSFTQSMVTKVMNTASEVFPHLSFKICYGDKDISVFQNGKVENYE
jgi:hypothetical protein